MVDFFIQYGKKFYCFFEHLVKQQGFNDIDDFSQSLLHVKQSNFVLFSTSFLTCLASWSEQYLGIKAIVLSTIVFLFILEIFTGTLNARRNNSYDSNKMPRGFIKMGVYIFFIGCSHVFAIHLPEPKIPLIDVPFNIYLYIYYYLLNFTIINLFVSNIENFEKLGWDEYSTLIRKIHEFLKLKKTNKDE